MADKSSIEWLNGGSTWNPIRAKLKQNTIIQLASGKEKLMPAGTWGYHCERISPGCVNCYACSMNGRTLPAWGTGLDYTVPNRDKVQIYLDSEELRKPIGWRRGRRIFPGSMTDWCAEFVPEPFIDAMLAIAYLVPRHDYLFLTKRSGRLADYFSSAGDLRNRIFDALLDARNFPGDPRRAVLGTPSRAGIAQGIGGGWRGLLQDHLRLGVSVEDQIRADERREHLKAIAKHGWSTWVSYEPALGPVNWKGWEFIRWMVIGGESGPGARPFLIRWAREAIAWCRRNRIPVFMKQVGADSDVTEVENRKGSDPGEWPEDLRIRQYAASMLPEESRC